MQTWIPDLRSRARLLRAGAVLALLLAANPAMAFTFEFEAADFALTPTFSNVQTFMFSIEVAGPAATGVYANPELVGVEYRVFGSLAMTRSGFSAFNLQRTIGGAEFDTQGSSLHFEISASACSGCLKSSFGSWPPVKASSFVGRTGSTLVTGASSGIGRSVIAAWLCRTEIPHPAVPAPCT